MLNAVIILVMTVISWLLLWMFGPSSYLKQVWDTFLMAFRLAVDCHYWAMECNSAARRVRLLAIMFPS